MELEKRCFRSIEKSENKDSKLREFQDRIKYIVRNPSNAGLISGRNSFVSSEDFDKLSLIPTEKKNGVLRITMEAPEDATICASNSCSGSKRLSSLKSPDLADETGSSKFYRENELRQFRSPKRPNFLNLRRHLFVSKKENDKVPDGASYDNRQGTLCGNNMNSGGRGTFAAHRKNGISPTDRHEPTDHSYYYQKDIGDATGLINPALLFNMNNGGIPRNGQRRHNDETDLLLEDMFNPPRHRDRTSSPINALQSRIAAQNEDIETECSADLNIVSTLSKNVFPVHVTAPYKVNVNVNHGQTVMSATRSCCRCPPDLLFAKVSEIVDAALKEKAKSSKYICDLFGPEGCAECCQKNSEVSGTQTYEKAKFKMKKPWCTRKQKDTSKCCNCDDPKKCLNCTKVFDKKGNLCRQDCACVSSSSQTSVQREPKPPKEKPLKEKPKEKPPKEKPLKGKPPKAVPSNTSTNGLKKLTAKMNLKQMFKCEKKPKCPCPASAPCHTKCTAFPETGGPKKNCECSKQPPPPPLPPPPATPPPPTPPPPEPILKPAPVEVKEACCCSQQRCCGSKCTHMVTKTAKSALSCACQKTFSCGGVCSASGLLPAPKKVKPPKPPKPEKLPKPPKPEKPPKPPKCAKAPKPEKPPKPPKPPPPPKQPKPAPSLKTNCSCPAMSTCRGQCATAIPQKCACAVRSSKLEPVTLEVKPPPPPPVCEPSPPPARPQRKVKKSKSVEHINDCECNSVTSCGRSCTIAVDSAGCLKKLNCECLMSLSCASICSSASAVTPPPTPPKKPRPPKKAPIPKKKPPMPKKSVEKKPSVVKSKSEPICNCPSNSSCARKCEVHVIYQKGKVTKTQCACETNLTSTSTCSSVGVQVRPEKPVALEVKPRPPVITKPKKVKKKIEEPKIKVKKQKKEKPPKTPKPPKPPKPVKVKPASRYVYKDCMCSSPSSYSTSVSSSSSCVSVKRPVKSKKRRCKCNLPLGCGSGCNVVVDKRGKSPKTNCSYGNCKRKSPTTADRGGKRRKLCACRNSYECAGNCAISVTKKGTCCTLCNCSSSGVLPSSSSSCQTISRSSKKQKKQQNVKVTKGLKQRSLRMMPVSVIGTGEHPPTPKQAPSELLNSDDACSLCCHPQKSVEKDIVTEPWRQNDEKPARNVRILKDAACDCYNFLPDLIKDKKHQASIGLNYSTPDTSSFTDIHKPPVNNSPPFMMAAEQMHPEKDKYVLNKSRPDQFGSVVTQGQNKLKNCGPCTEVGTTQCSDVCLTRNSQESRARKRDTKFTMRDLDVSPEKYTSNIIEEFQNKKCYWDNAPCEKGNKSNIRKSTTRQYQADEYDQKYRTIDKCNHLNSMSKLNQQCSGECAKKRHDEDSNSRRVNEYDFSKYKEYSQDQYCRAFRTRDYPQQLNTGERLKSNKHINRPQRITAMECPQWSQPSEYPQTARGLSQGLTSTDCPQQFKPNTSDYLQPMCSPGRQQRLQLQENPQQLIPRNKAQECCGSKCYRTGKKKPCQATQIQNEEWGSSACQRNDVESPHEFQTRDCCYEDCPELGTGVSSCHQRRPRSKKTRKEKAKCNVILQTNASNNASAVCSSQSIDSLDEVMKLRQLEEKNAKVKGPPKKRIKIQNSLAEGSVYDKRKARHQNVEITVIPTKSKSATKQEAKSLPFPKLNGFSVSIKPSGTASDFTIRSTLCPNLIAGCSCSSCRSES